MKDTIQPPKDSPESFSEWCKLGFEAVMNPKYDKGQQVTVGEGLCAMHVMTGEKVPTDLLQSILETHPVGRDDLGQLLNSWNRMVELIPESAEQLKEMNLGTLSTQLSMTSRNVYDGVKQSLILTGALVLFTAREGLE